MRAALAVALIVGTGATGCATDKQRYCDAVQSHQEALSKVLGPGGPDAMLTALPTLKALRKQAMPDIEDEWVLVTDRIAALAAALDQAGVDAATYDAADTDVDPADRVAIEQAAEDLGAQEAQRAWADLQQQARDVCGTPLFLG